MALGKCNLKLAPHDPDSSVVARDSHSPHPRLKSSLLIIHTAGGEQDRAIREIIGTGDRECREQLLAPNLKKTAIATCNGRPRTTGRILCARKLYSNHRRVSSGSGLLLYVPGKLAVSNDSSPELSVLPKFLPDIFPSYAPSPPRSN